MNRTAQFVCCAHVFVSSCLCAPQPLLRADSRADGTTLAELIAPYGQPPAEYADQLSPHRSPLLFRDGTPVTRADQWPRRRAEILADWTRELGPWPELIEHPRVEALAEEQADGLTWRRIRIEIALRQFPEAWLLIPHSQKPAPAVLVVYYDPGTAVGRPPEGKDGAHRDFALQLARRGFVTLSIGTPGGDAYHPNLGDAKCQPLSFHAFVAANCWHALADMPEVDSRRIGIAGHSYGGKWSLFAAALWDRFAAVALSDPGVMFDDSRPSVNYWEPWYLGEEPGVPRRRAGVPTPDNPATGAYARLRAAGHDLHELHALIAPRPFLVSGGSEDPPERWTALNHARAVNRLLGHNGRVLMTNRPGHTPTAESNAVLYAFFEYFLQP